MSKIENTDVYANRSILEFSINLEGYFLLAEMANELLVVQNNVAILLDQREYKL